MPKHEGTQCNMKGGAYWYYDLSVKKCKQFNYNGCGGNANRFIVEVDCKGTCNPSGNDDPLAEVKNLPC